MLLRKTFKFDAAHNLVRYHGKCEALHGHTYRLKVGVRGEPDEEGMIIDFLVLKQIVRDNAISVLDHSYINDIIRQPTAENIASWIWKRIEGHILQKGCQLEEIELWETDTSSVLLLREDMK